MVCYRREQVAVEAAAAHAGLLARQWWSRTWKSRIDAASSNVERAELREQALADKARRIEAGEVAFSRNDLLRHELDTLLREIEWDRRRWKPVPDEVLSAPGRRWGAKTGEMGAYDGYVHVDVDDRVGEIIRRGCYWTSEQATRELRAWYDRHSRGPAHVHDLPGALQGLYLMVMGLKMPTADQLADRDFWRNVTITPGDVLRRVVVRAGEGYEPPELQESKDD